jgi:RNA polymerase sigma-70 factor (ECF subfamily)
VRSAGSQSVDLDRLFRLYARELNAFAYRRLRNREAAEDVVQDGFERFTRWTKGRDGEDSASNPRFFLWTVVGNLTLDLIRRNRLNVFQPMTDAAAEFADHSPSADRRLEARDDYRLVKAVLAELPPRHRMALLLNRVEGLTHAEISARLGVSKSMVSKYIMGALELCLIRFAARDR